MAYEQFLSHFSEKGYWCTEYHIGVFSGDVRNFRLHYSYLGRFYASAFMLKLLAHLQFTVISWHSMVQWLTYTKKGKTLLPDDYEFGANMNYAFFSLFKDLILNMTNFTTLALQGMKNYMGLGECTGVYKDV